MCAKKIVFGIILHVICKNGEYLESITANSVITCDEMIETTSANPTKTVPEVFQQILTKKR